MIAAVVLHTMNIEGQIHQKNLGNARILAAFRTVTPPLAGLTNVTLVSQDTDDRVDTDDRIDPDENGDL